MLNALRNSITWITTILAMYLAIVVLDSKSALAQEKKAVDQFEKKYGATSFLSSTSAGSIGYVENVCDKKNPAKRAFIRLLQAGTSDGAISTFEGASKNCFTLVINHKNDDESQSEFCAPNFLFVAIVHLTKNEVVKEQQLVRLFRKGEFSRTLARRNDDCFKSGSSKSFDKQFSGDEISFSKFNLLHDTQGSNERLEALKEFERIVGDYWHGFPAHSNLFTWNDGRKFVSRIDNLLSNHFTSATDYRLIRFLPYFEKYGSPSGPLALDLRPQASDAVVVKFFSPLGSDFNRTVVFDNFR